LWARGPLSRSGSLMPETTGIFFVSLLEYLKTLDPPSY
jgi:hypothetical protein